LKCGLGFDIRIEELAATLCECQIRHTCLACENEEARKHSHHRFTETVRHSLHDGFTAYSALSPVIGLVCHRRRHDIVANSMPASRHQDHATSLSAGAVARLSTHHGRRIPRPASVTIAIRPSRWARDRGKPEVFRLNATSAHACGKLARRAICAWRQCVACRAKPEP
jgi:hypothetical protein